MKAKTKTKKDKYIPTKHGDYRDAVDHMYEWAKNYNPEKQQMYLLEAICTQLVILNQKIK